ncbi:MAG: hypothetical protein KKA73_11825 [Chloroflexi bacterium]|nr:hypothetical protein [Chloroflexota bacterium]MBU1748368.1 hypothetical protein [Chloroflexota bacterium]
MSVASSREKRCAIGIVLVALAVLFLWLGDCLGLALRTPDRWPLPPNIVAEPITIAAHWRSEAGDEYVVTTAGLRLRVGLPIQAVQRLEAGESYWTYLHHEPGPHSQWTIIRVDELGAGME